MIKLRLKRYGKKREASYRIVAALSTSRREGRPIEELGFYNPRTDETKLNNSRLFIDYQLVILDCDLGSLKLGTVASISFGNAITEAAGAFIRLKEVFIYFAIFV